jgi:hypothetical protein
MPAPSGLCTRCLYPLYAEDLCPREHPEAFEVIPAALSYERYEDPPSLKPVAYDALAAPQYDKPQGLQSNFYLPQQTY